MLMPPPSIEEKRAEKRRALLERVKHLYSEHGPEALSKPFLMKHKLYDALISHSINRTVLFAELGITESVEEWSKKHRFYRGQFKPEWSWEQVVKVAKQVAEEHDGNLPTLTWLRKNNSGLAAAIFNIGHTYEELRAEVNSFKSSHFRQSRNRMRWRSQPECCLSDFLYARGIQHKRGEGYAALNPEHAGHNKYDLHFLNPNGEWIDVEIWGNMEYLAGDRYTNTRAKKEAWREGDPKFLGIEFTDCLVEKRLEDILEPYIGRIAPFVFDKPTDKLIETAHWSSSDELIESCRQIAAMQPDGQFPNEQWLRKRGRYADRAGEAYNTIAIYINQWLGGIRKVREILGQSHASTSEWTPEALVTVWEAFVQEHGVSPAQANGRKGYEHLPIEVLRRGAQIYQSARRYGVVKQAWANGTRRKISGRQTSKWTPDTVESAWRAFVAKHGKWPSQCIARHKTLPREVVLEAQNIYSAARKLNLVKKLRGEPPSFQ